ncbi:hypothetical protein IG631_01484 [Alternaria alternata]|nr:hypothetical protein IG631_01484 [Alternaria alternata]
MHLLCSSCSPSTSTTGAEKYAADRPIARSVDAVPNSPLLPPCLLAIVHLCRELGRLGKKLR